jgi:hypothetical protein
MRPDLPSPGVSEEQDKLLVVMVLRAVASPILLVPFVKTPNPKNESFTSGRMVSALTMVIFDDSMTPQTKPIWH